MSKPLVLIEARLNVWELTNGEPLLGVKLKAEQNCVRPWKQKLTTCWALRLETPPSRTMLYQSTEALKPGSQCGLARTTPTVAFLAISGFRLALPVTFCRTVSAPPVNGLVKLGSVVVTGAANSSDRFGARTSREVTARRRMPSIGVSQVAPTFQV